MAALVLLPIAVLASPILVYVPGWIRSALGPPHGAFPGSVGEVDGKGSLSWWGCMKLPSGDAREVGSYGDRALFFMPGGKCERQPALPGTDEHLFVTWSETRETGDRTFGSIRLIVSGACPMSVSDTARKEALQLVGEYLAARKAPDRYRADALAAQTALQNLQGSTRPLREEGVRTSGEARFNGGLWGPLRRPGTYPVCVES